MNHETWVILGATSSISRAFAHVAASHGANLILAGRDMEDMERSAADLRIRHGVRAEAIPFDATDHAGHGAFAKTCRERSGRLNIFLAFGVMYAQDEVDADFELARRTIEGNYLGAVSILERFRPILEAQGGGRIVALGSVAGDRGRPSNYVYGSAKAGLHAYLSGLRPRLWKSGVTVTVVKPGFTDTAMTWGLPGMFLVNSPDACALSCWKAGERGAAVQYAPGFWRIIMFIIRMLPDFLFKRLDF